MRQQTLVVGSELDHARNILLTVFAALACLAGVGIGLAGGNQAPATGTEQLRFQVLEVPEPDASFDDLCCDPANEIAKADAQMSLRTGYGAEPHWIRFLFEIRPGFLVLSAIVDQAELYTRDPVTGEVRTKIVGDSIATSSRERISTRLAFPLDDIADGSELLLKVTQPTDITLRFDWMSETVFVESESRMNITRAFLLGGVLIIVVYNFVLFLIARDSTFLFNGLTIFGLLLLDLYLTGVGAAYLWGNFPALSNIILTFSVTQAIVCGGLFFAKFLSGGQNKGNRETHILILPALVTLVFLLQFVVPYWWLQPAMVLIGLLMPFQLLLICSRRAMAGDARAKILLVPLIMAIAPGVSVVLLQKIAGVEFRGLDHHLLEITLIVEALLFSLALAHRIRLAEREKEHAYAALDASHTNSRRSLLKTIDADRTRIANELHDTAAHGLLAVSARLGHLGRDTKLPTTTRRELSEISDLSGVLISEIRRISHDLHSGVLEHLGLGKAIDGLLARLRASGIEADGFKLHLPEHRLNSRQQEQIYRIVQELLTNVVKHADASRVSISLKNQGELAILTVSDNGRGMSSEDGRTGGLGLSIAGQRAAALGAEWVTESGESGTIVRLTFPIAAGDSRTESDSQNNTLGRQSSDISGRHTCVD